jgi:uncharacterized protein (TIGR04255 family)
MDRMKDFVYDKPPLIEVICEIRWGLQPLSAIPGSSYDPHFPAFAEDFASLIGKSHYTFVERLPPVDLPIELRAGNPVLRFRRQQNEWPLFQIGPGLLTVNVVPPYGGWHNFRSTLQLGISRLYESYPLSKRYLKFTRVDLRYLNGFDGEFGYVKHGAFLADDLTIRVSLNEQLVMKYAREPDDVITTAQFVMNLKTMKQSTGIIKVGPGLKDGKKAAVLELTIRRGDGKAHLNMTREKDLAGWFDSAHEVIREWFQLTTSEAVKARMGLAREVKEE